MKKTGRSNWDALRKDQLPIKRRRADVDGVAVTVASPASQPALASTPIVAIDCEMVAAGPLSMLCRVVVVGNDGQTLLNTWVAPAAPVTDYRTALSGATAERLVGAPSAASVRAHVVRLLEKSIIVGHDLRHDFRALDIKIPSKQTRDTARYPPLLSARGRPQSLRWLARTELGRVIQRGQHSPIEDAVAALDIYKKHRAAWEQHIRDAKREAKRQHK